MARQPRTFLKIGAEDPSPIEILPRLGTRAESQADRLTQSGRKRLKF